MSFHYCMLTLAMAVDSSLDSHGVYYDVHSTWLMDRGHSVPESCCVYEALVEYGNRPIKDYSFGFSSSRSCWFVRLRAKK